MYMYVADKHVNFPEITTTWEVYPSNLVKFSHDMTVLSIQASEPNMLQ